MLWWGLWQISSIRAASLRIAAFFSFPTPSRLITFTAYFFPLPFSIPRYTRVPGCPLLINNSNNNNNVRERQRETEKQRPPEKQQQQEEEKQEEEERAGESRRSRRSRRMSGRRMRKPLQPPKSFSLTSFSFHRRLTKWGGGRGGIHSNDVISTLW